FMLLIHFSFVLYLLPLHDALPIDREREGRHEVALKLYRAANYPPSRERIARILYKDEAYEEALRECVQMLRNPWNEQEETAATRSEEHTSELQSLEITVYRLPLEK